MTTLRMRGQEATLVDLLDRLLDKGVVVLGEATLGVADVDLIFASLRLVVTSVDKIRSTQAHPGHGGGPWGAPAPDGPVHPAAPPRGGALDLPLPLLPVARDTGSGAPAPVGAGAPDPDRAANGLAQLVLMLAELLRQVLEREALRRMERGTLNAVEVERLGRGLLRLEQRMRELRELFHLRAEDLSLHLGPLGRLI